MCEEQRCAMTGCNNSFKFVHDVKKLADDQFFRLSQLIALSLWHGCPCPRYMLDFQSLEVPSINITPNFKLWD